MTTRYLEKISRLQADFERERSLYLAQIARLQQELDDRDREDQRRQAGGSGSNPRGEGSSRRGGSRRG
jgi:hypothetical protein